MNVARRIGALATLACLGITGTACSSSSGSGSGGSGDIKIMAIGVMQSSALSFPDMGAALQANVDSINAAGGINGRQLKLEKCNDKDDPNTAVDCARKAVSDKVVAVTEPYEPFSQQLLPFLQAGHIPVVYGTLVSTADGTSPNSFPRDAGVPDKYAALALELAKAGCKTVGAVVVSNPNNQLGATWIGRGAKAAGATFVQTSVSVDQADYAAPVAKLISQGAQCIIPDTNPDQGAKIVAAVEQSGKPVKLGALTAEFGASQLQALGSGAEGMLLIGQEFLPTDTNVPAVSEIVQGMAKYQPSVKLEDFAGIAGWAGISAIKQVLQAVKGNVTAQSAQAAAAAITLDTGLYDKVSFAQPGPFAEYPRVTNWGYLAWTVHGGKAVLRSPDFVDLPSGV
jgi:ABC-type branched-subunit amino acid transport system substrate-binding protein